jgi:AraC-like DNA-binding protein
MATTEPPRNDGAFGQRLGDCFGLKQAPSFTTRILTNATIGVTRITCAHERNGLTAPIPVQDAFLMTLQLADCPAHDLWIEGRPAATGPLRRGAISIYDLRQQPIVNSVSAFRNIHFYLPRSSLNALVEEDGGQPIDELPNNPGLGVEDPVASGLGLSLETAFDHPDEVTRLFVDHITVAMALHIARTFGVRPARHEVRGRLSPVQERLVKEMLEANLAGEVTMGELASACGLGVTAFRRGFAAATGMLPHQWLAQRRAERAAELLRHTSLSLEDVARQSGFADVGHMRRAFAGRAGGTPEACRSA